MSYWENEQPTTIDTGKNILRYFKEAGKLQVSQPNWINKENEEKPGKTVTVDLKALKETPEALKLIKQIIEQ